MGGAEREEMNKNMMNKIMQRSAARGLHLLQRRGLARRLLSGGSAGTSRPVKAEEPPTRLPMILFFMIL